MADKQRSKFKLWWGRIRKGFWRHWIDFVSVLLRRVIDPIAQPSFVFYFLGIILVVGGLGVSISIATSLNSGSAIETTTIVPRSLSTYLLAILATAYVDINLEEPTKRSLRMFALFVLVIGTIGAVIALLISNIRWAYGCAIFGTVLALFLSWVANAANVRLFEPTPPADAPTGGSTAEIKGTLEGFVS